MISLIDEAYTIARKYNSRGEKHLYPMHSAIGELLPKKDNVVNMGYGMRYSFDKDGELMETENYNIDDKNYYKGEEQVVKGANNYKKIDIISIKTNQKYIVNRYRKKNIISLDEYNWGSVSFVRAAFASYAKNSNNYFEQEMGQVSNLRDVNINVSSIFLLPNEVIKREKNKEDGTEKVQISAIEKYYELYKKGKDKLYRPDQMLIYIMRALPDGTFKGFRSKQEIIDQFDIVDDDFADFLWNMNNHEYFLDQFNNE